MKFTNKSVYELHLSLAHQKNEKTVTNKGNETPEDDYKTTISDEENDKNEECETDKENGEFDTQNSLIVERENKCSLCHFSTWQRAKLQKHIETVHEGKNLARNQCQLCDYSCSTRANLRR